MVYITVSLYYYQCEVPAYQWREEPQIRHEESERQAELEKKCARNNLLFILKYSIKCILSGDAHSLLKEQSGDFSGI